ncbi:SAM-dependent DNA methyltransferase [Nocardiopsis gilva YIM 90087]|uniref:site-specific DNA-methyltransferase (adenine-specific) n=1 Tax=Nocardiopsis gilva YIM 90087 TaxID=1235441 RepID=A0A223S0N1_9ACTN|nr:BREX-2 system adenine-specific DNA-methyltransferase PglX [Nocardiopsis gilva]ASU81695.1 SAM-dependent DNA methyltransferase [Nocardiopsis gilva YIM 90087]
MASRGAEQGGLLKDLRTQVKRLEDDLRPQSEDVAEFKSALEDEYSKAREAGRIAVTYGVWRDERITQVAAAWVLGTLFVRFCEDNGLIEHPWIAGPGDRLELAEARHSAFFQERPDLNDRDWLIAAFGHLSECHPTAAGLFDRSHNPLWQVTPSYEAASELLKFWRRIGPDGEIVHDFTDDDLDTRFLGDLYQDLSEHARKTYALLQTPEFVEEFILDLTLDPAIEEFGIEPELEIKDGSGNVEWHHVGLRTIDPACGSGHFLLGLFKRLLNKHRGEAGPGVDDWKLIRKALDSVHGCDKNPFAVSIARFRILVEVLKESGIRRMDRARVFPINVAVGDSLLHGRGQESVTSDLFSSEKIGMFAFETEDVWDYSKRIDLLGAGSYHVVVANPPYITVKDKKENQNYRRAYFACSGGYSLSVPFAQRIFGLAVRVAGTERRAGFTGQITANSFMKREFGKVLIESYFHGGPYKHPVTNRRRDFTGVDLTHVIDTSGAYIPGHGTPTVIIAGRNRVASQREAVRAVLGVQGEPEQPEDPSKGLVWRAIIEQVDSPGGGSAWVTVEDVGRSRFAKHPWSLSGGGANSVLEVIERASSQRLNSLGVDLGFVAITGEDEVFLVPGDYVNRLQKLDSRPLVQGENVRDYSVSHELDAIWSHAPGPLIGSPHPRSRMYRHFWPYRENLLQRKRFGIPVADISGMLWTDVRELYPRRFYSDRYLVYPFVATHNHFSLVREQSICIRTAPVVKLSGDATEEDYIRLLGILNSSTACFWLKQVCQGKGNRGGERSTGRWEWEEYYEFTGTKLQDFPLPAELPLELGGVLDSLAGELASTDPSAIVAKCCPSRESLDVARRSHRKIRRRMIALQEESDWRVYRLYGFLSDSESIDVSAADIDEVPEVELGERAFEIVLARRVAAGGDGREWFDRHGSTPITEIPSHWPDWYRDIVQRRIDVIESRRDIELIERPECKRRWSSESWKKKEREALRSWLLDRCEDRDLWFHERQGLEGVPRPMTVADLADAIASSPNGPDVMSVAELYAADHRERPDVRLVDVLREIVADQHVPYLSGLRYKDSGLRKREQWEDTWEKQREEDKTGQRLDIPVPPKYTSADFRKQSYWSNRGKLDVSKERFVSYPDAGPASDPTLVLGWAGWDHKEQAEALMHLVEDRVEQDDWSTEQVTPLLAGLLELLPWIKQWHSDYDEVWEGTPAEQVEQWLADQRDRFQVTDGDLRSWRPAPARRGRKASSA